jgi:lysophospholipase L1-like esterase
MQRSKLGLLVIGVFGAWFWIIPGHTQPAVTSDAKEEAVNLIRNTQNDTSWKVLAGKIRALKENHTGVVSIVELGDSHIQGGYFSSRVRELFRVHYGIAGRGLVFPYSLLQTNGPEDVRFTSSAKWVGDKYNRASPNNLAGIAGYTLLLTDSIANLAITLRQGSDTLYPISRVRVYHNTPFLRIRSNGVLPVVCQKLDSLLFVSVIEYEGLKDSVMLRLSFHPAKTTPQIYGIELLNNLPGIRFHTMGVNGASYESYAKTIQYLPMLKALHPDCVILSLGTNDAYVDRLDTAQLRRRVVSMIAQVRRAAPGCNIMLTTPGDHLRKKEILNHNLVTVHAILTSVAISQNCVYWDFFQVMGGLGSSRNWLKKGWMYKDVLHLSKDGYKVQGEMFFEALNLSL